MTLKVFSITCYLAILTSQVMCREFSKCYDDANLCLWTDGSVLTQSEAQRACQQRNDSFLPRITDSSVQSKFEDFRTAAGDLLNNGGSWIDVIESNINNFHWIDGSQLAGTEVLHQENPSARFAVITYEARQFRFSARLLNSLSSFICQLPPGASCAGGGLSMNSICYRKFDGQLSWYDASNNCLSRGGSLAVFTDIGRPSDNRLLTVWLDIDRQYWIGLVRSWWNTTSEDGRSVDIQYSNWGSGHPETSRSCVVIGREYSWYSIPCSDSKKYVCQNYIRRTLTTTVSTTTETSPYTPSNGTPVSANVVAPRQSKCEDGKFIGIGIAIGVGASCIIAVIVVLIYCCACRTRGKADEQPVRDNAGPADSHYVIPNSQPPAQPSQYAPIQLENRGSATDHYIQPNTSYYDDLQHDQRQDDSAGYMIIR